MVETDSRIAALDAAQISGDRHIGEARNGIYLALGDSDRAAVTRGGGGTMSKIGKIRGWGGVIDVSDVRTTAEALRAGGLDWRVVQKPVGVDAGRARGNVGSRDAEFEDSGEQSWGDAPDYVANVREDTGDVLGIVGRNWRGPQNAEAFALMDDLVDDGSAKWLGAGARDGGKRVFGLVTWDREIIPGGDVDERCICLGLIASGWNGSLALSITSAPFRLACLNGMMIPLPGALRTYKVRHTSGVEGRVQEARKALGIAWKTLDQFESAAETLISTRLTPYEFDRFVETLVPVAEDATARVQANAVERREAIRSAYGDDDLANVRGTAWGAYQAVTAYSDWGVTSRAKSAEVEGQRRLFSAFGHENTASNAALKEAAYRILVG